MVSIPLRALTVSVVVVCIVAVTCLSTSFAVFTSDSAISDTKRNYQDALDIAFSASERTIIIVTEDYLNQQADTAVRLLEGFHSVTDDLVSSVCAEVMSENTQDVSNWEYIYSWRTRLFHAMARFHQLDGVGFATEKTQLFQIYENNNTFGRPRGAYHQYHSVLNNGTDYDIEAGLPASIRTAFGDIIQAVGPHGMAEGRGDTFGYPQEALTFPFECLPESGVSVETDGKVLSPPCVHPQFTMDVPYFMLYDRIEVGQAMYLPLISLGRYAGILCQCVYTDSSGKKIGNFWAGADLRKVTEYLRTLELGAEKGSKGRVFVTVRENWAEPGKHVGYLAGTSHGSTVTETDTPIGRIVVPMSAVNCTDSIVSGSATYLQQTHTNATTGEKLSYYEYIYQSGTHHEFCLKTGDSGEEEVFYAVVHVFDNAMGLNWHVNSVVDKAYVLGAVENASRQTRVSTTEREDEIDEDLRQAREVLYIVVVAAALFPIGLTVFLMYRITQPLIQLMNDMQLVAVMTLDDIDLFRPPSFLREVALMEEAFCKMTTNLIEYKQYLPQAILNDALTDDDATTNALDTGSVHEVVTSLTPSVLSVLSTGTTPVIMTPPQKGNGQNVFDAVLRLRSISVAVTNLRGVLQKRNDATKLSDTLAMYIEMFAVNAKKYRGIIDSVSGDRVAVCFNTTVHTVAHMKKAAEFCIFLQNAWKETLQLNSAVSYGSALCGNIGCAGFKTNALLGGVACNARMIERCGRSWEVPIICDSGIAAEARDVFILRTITKVITKLGKLTMLHELVCLKDTGVDEEWMYQIHHGESSDPYTKINSVISLIYQGEFLDAAAKLETCKSARGAILAQRMLVQVRKTGHAPLPLKIFDIPQLNDYLEDTEDGEEEEYYPDMPDMI